MAISRRIFRKQYKRPKPRIAIRFNNKIKSEITRKYKNKLLTRKNLRAAPLYKFLNIRNWNCLDKNAQLQEQSYAVRDISIFAKHYIPRNTTQPKENNFRAYLPGEV